MSHLGGYNLNDELTYYPRLWDWLADYFDLESVLDVGAGQGRARRYFDAMPGVYADGIDGLGGEGIMRWDYRDGPAPLDDEWDLCWSCEFVEHVEEEFVPNFLDTFAHCRIVAMSHALPGQIGHHHVNCQRASYWTDLMTDRGFVLSAEGSLYARELAALDSLDGHFVKTGLLFRS